MYTKTRASRSKWKKVLDFVLQDFADRKFADGAQFYTLEQLCVHYEVSDITGRRVFSELKNRGLISSRGRRGTVVTGQMAAQDVYMCLPSIYFDAGVGGVSRYLSFTRLFEGFTSEPFARQFRVHPISLAFLCNNLDSFANRHIIVSTEALVDFSQQPSAVNYPLLQQLRATVNPVIFDSYGGLPEVTQVGVDFYQGIRKVVRHLVSRGHTHIGYFSGDVNDFWLQPRFRGFVDGLFAEGKRFDPALLLMTATLDRDENLEALNGLLNRPQHPTAVVCANDARAMFVLEYCRLHGIAVPDEMAVTGFDDIPEAALAWAPLTTVNGMEVEIGRKTLGLLNDRQEGRLKEPCEVVIDPELVVRVSG